MYASFPNWDDREDGWGGPPPGKKGDEVYVARDEGLVFKVDENLAYDEDYEKSARSDYPVVIKFCIGDLVDDFLHSNEILETRLLDEETIEQARSMAQALKAAASKLESAILKVHVKRSLKMSKIKM